MSMPAEYLSAAATLSELLQGIVSAPPVALRGISSDSRKVRDGYLFVACQGIGSHGLEYIDGALQNGAAAVVYDGSSELLPGDLTIPAVYVPQLAARLGDVANRFYHSPSHRLDVIAVTGTNGKTTVAWMIAHCLQRVGKRCGYLGTLGHGIGELARDNGMTTPSTLDLHGRLAEFVDAGASHAALEVSSHALDQNRIDGVRVRRALFTNLTRDHLDYHGDMPRYFAAKSKLFTDTTPDCSIVDTDTEYGRQLAELCTRNVVFVSSKERPATTCHRFVFADSVTATEFGSSVSVHSSWGNAGFDLPLPGRFNVSNALLALAELLVDGIPLEDACELLSGLEAPPGRLERVNGGNVFVDYAHTPDALTAVLTALRPHCTGRLWCVFGCGGDRDSGKRPMMGRIAEQYADVAVVTSDNPRSEAPEEIIQDILKGFSGEPVVIEDRAAAISWAVSQADSNDAVLIAGKGHEYYQEIASERLPFSDYAVAAAAGREDSA